jgi:hypothetical protein
MTAKNYTASFTVDQSPNDVFAAVNNVRGWWSGEIDGRSRFSANSPCEGELEARRIDTDGFGSSRIEGRGHGSLSVHPEDQVRSWSRAFG